MPDTISPETLPDWPYNDLKTEEVILLACLLGKHGKQPLTGVFGHVMLLWEASRHHKELVKLLAKQRSVPTNDDWKNDPAYSTLFKAPLGFITSMPEFPVTPFFSLEAEHRTKLVEEFTPGQPALEIGNIEVLDTMGVLERLNQSASFAKEERQHKKAAERFKEPAILKREKLNPWESVYDVIFTLRTNLGKKAVLRDFAQWVENNPELFPKINTSAVAQQWRDPRPVLRDLAVLRLVILHGYSGARKWTKEHRPHTGPLKANYERYVGERGNPKGNNPLHDSNDKCKKAVKRALKQLRSLEGGGVLNGRGVRLAYPFLAKIPSFRSQNYPTVCDGYCMSTHGTRPYRPRQKQSVSQELLDLDQAADFLGTSRRFVEMEVARGRLTKIMLSRRLARISRDELKRYAGAHTV